MVSARCLPGLKRDPMEWTGTPWAGAESQPRAFSPGFRSSLTLHLSGKPPRALCPAVSPSLKLWKHSQLLCSGPECTFVCPRFPSPGNEAGSPRWQTLSLILLLEHLITLNQYLVNKRIHKCMTSCLSGRNQCRKPRSKFNRGECLWGLPGQVTTRST